MIKALCKTASVLPALALLMAAPAQARLSSHDIDVDIITDSGYRSEEYPVARDHNTYRAYVQAKRGQEYSVRVQNRSNRRIGVVIAVDGRNIISGDKSRLRPGERMYVLNPYETASYSGWRTGKNRVNRFYFTDAGGSYAAAWGDYSAMGVIAVAAFAEKHYYPQPYDKYDGRSSSERSSKRHAPGVQSEPGTGFGDSEWSPSKKVHFEPEPHAFARHFLKYEWRKSLCEKEVIDCHQSTNYREKPDYQEKPVYRNKPGNRNRPNRFWDDDAHSRYAPYPPVHAYVKKDRR